MSASEIDRIEIHHRSGQVTTLRDIHDVATSTTRRSIEITKGGSLNEPADPARKYIAGPEQIVLEVVAGDISDHWNAITRKPPALLRWDRVGDQGQDAHQFRPLDVSHAVDMGVLRRLIEDQVQIALHSGEWDVQLKIEVNLRGGPWRELPFGYGRIEMKP